MCVNPGGGKRSDGINEGNGTGRRGKLDEYGVDFTTCREDASTAFSAGQSDAPTLSALINKSSSSTSSLCSATDCVEAVVGSDRTTGFLTSGISLTTGFPIFLLPAISWSSFSAVFTLIALDLLFFRTNTLPFLLHVCLYAFSSFSALSNIVLRIRVKFGLICILFTIQFGLDFNQWLLRSILCAKDRCTNLQ